MTLLLILLTCVFANQKGLIITVAICMYDAKCEDILSLIILNYDNCQKDLLTGHLGIEKLSLPLGRINTIIVSTDRMIEI